MKNTFDSVKVLKDAKKYIQNNGWCQGATQRGAARCVSFAIESASPGVESTHPNVLDLAMQPFRKFEKAIDGQSIPAWNDNRMRTYKEVMVAFDKAIKVKV